MEMLRGLNVDPYSYDNITDNPWPFKTRNRGKRTSTFSSPHSVFGCRVCENVFKSCLHTQMTRPFDSTNFTLSRNLFL
jgi:hypothetical protein